MRGQIIDPSSPAKHVVRAFFLFLVVVIYAIDANSHETHDEDILHLVKRAKEGDDDSFASLFELYYPQILRHLYRMVGNEEDASDLAADTFIRAWYQLPRIRDERRFRAWLYKIATNAALDYRRIRNTQKYKIQGALSLPEEYVDEGAARFEDQVEEQELIRLALEQVAPRPKACYLLYEEGFSYAEIAVLMGMKRKSVGTYISNAREQFRRAYNRLKNQ